MLWYRSPHETCQTDKIHCLGKQRVGRFSVLGALFHIFQGKILPEDRPAAATPNSLAP